jgi:CubicO group peptidase (beta-lactamase class C family)
MALLNLKGLLLQFATAFWCCSVLSCKNPESPDIQPPAPPVEPYAWNTSTYEAQRVNRDSIVLALQEFRDKLYVESFVLVRNGFLLNETYFTLANQYTRASIASMTKSITSALVGIALREQYLDSLGEKLLDFFPEYSTPALDPRKGNITIEHLLTMRSGFDYTEGDDHSNIFNQNTNWMREAINIPLRTEPGQSFNYASVNAHLVSGILTKTSHMSTMDIAQRFLLQPLGIHVLAWPKDPQNYYFAGSGMILYPRDLARFGYLYVNHGSLEGHPIVPAEWVQVSTQPHDGGSRTWGAFRNVKYGYFWWTAQWNLDSVFLAVGFGGQFMIGVPRYNLVIVVTSNVDCTPTEADERHFSLLDIIARHVITAVRE